MRSFAIVFAHTFYNCAKAITKLREAIYTMIIYYHHLLSSFNIIIYYHHLLTSFIIIIHYHRLLSFILDSSFIIIIYYHNLVYYNSSFLQHSSHIRSKCLCPSLLILFSFGVNTSA